MIRLIAMRLASAVPNLIGVVVITFLLTRMLPGDPAAYFAGPAATAESINEIRHKLGLDRDMAAQFVGYVGDLAHGDLGRSLTSGQPVIADLVNRLPASLELTAIALVLALVVGIALGVAAALRPGGVMDVVCSLVSMIGQAMPTFFLGLLLIFVFYYLLDWTSAPLGRLDVTIAPPPRISGFLLLDSLLAGNLAVFAAAAGQLVLPATTLALFGVGPVSRMTRASLLEVLASDFVRTARAAGLKSRTVLWTYAFHNAAVPIVITAGMVFSFLLGANVLVEKVFGWPGVGAYAIEAVLASDFAPVQGFVLLMAALYIVVNLALDVVTTLLDPGVSHDV